jgi:hypothetical protein
MKEINQSNKPMFNEECKYPEDFGPWLKLGRFKAPATDRDRECTVIDTIKPKKPSLFQRLRSWFKSKTKSF